MNKRVSWGGLFWIAALAMPLLFSCSKDDNTAVEELQVPTIEEKLLETGLILLNIQTKDSEFPTCEYVSAPSGGSIGRGITNNKKVEGRLVLKQRDQILYDSGEYIEDESGMTIRVRGNSSAYSDKKPYKIQLQKKADLLLRGEQYKDKSWVLIKDCEAMTIKDEMSLRPFIGMKAAELVGMEYVPQGRYVNVIINDDYKGIYFLSENVKRNEKCRVNISKADGFLIEYDPYWWNESVFFDTGYTSAAYKFTFKYPDDDLTDGIIADVRNTMLQIEASLRDDTYDSYLDVESFVNWILFHDMLGTGDGGGINKYMYKYDNSSNTLIKMGPLWDFDGILQLTDSWPYVHGNDVNNFYYRRLFKSSSFVETYCERWGIISKTFYTKLSQIIDEFITSEEGISLMLSRSLEHELCGIEYQSLSENALTAKTFFEVRRQWLSEEIEEMKK